MLKAVIDPVKGWNPRHTLHKVFV